MKSVFISYTFDPDPQYAADNEDLKRRIATIVQSMELLPITGEDLAGANVAARVRTLIDKCDACISVLTPHRAGSNPPWVTDEFAFAQGKNKRGIRVIHEALYAANQGMFANDEYILYRPGNALDAMMKLMRTIAIWKREAGRPAEVEIAPNTLARQFDPTRDRCEYQLFLPDNTYTPWQSAVARREPGGIYAHIPGLPDDAKVCLRMSLNGERWESDYHNPISRIELQQR